MPILTRSRQTNYSTNRLVRQLRHHKKPIIASVVVVIIIATAVIFVPWNKVGDRFAQGAGEPDQGTKVTAEQAADLTNRDGDDMGADLAEQDYRPIRTINRYMGTWKMPNDDIILHGVVTLWTYCPGYGVVASECTDPNGKNTVEHPDLITTSKWDGRAEDNHTAVVLVGIIIPAEVGTVWCLTPGTTSASSPALAAQIIDELGSLATDGKLHELTINTTLEDPWQCRGFGKD